MFSNLDANDVLSAVHRLGTGALESQYEPTKISIPIDIEQTPITGVACGARHTVLWTSDGLCYGFGSNTYYQLPIKTDESHHVENQVSQVYLPLLARSAIHPFGI